jgi:hypothetical protein
MTASPHMQTRIEERQPGAREPWADMVDAKSQKKSSRRLLPPWTAAGDLAASQCGA